MNRRIAFALIALVLGFALHAQELSPAMENAITICSNLSKTIEGSNLSQLKAINKEFRNAKIENFGDLWPTKGKELALDKHFIFDEDFVDSLIVNRKVIEFSAQYARLRSSRSASGRPGRVKITTKAIKAGQKAEWKTVNRDVAEYALVSEPGGLFTMTVRDEKGKVLYTETVKNKAGDSVRRAKMQLPDATTPILIEVKNCGKNDASFALIGN